MKTFEPLSVCVDCIEYIANGEAETPKRLERAIQATIGKPSGALAYDGEDLGFSWEPCEACGSTLGGERFKAFVEAD